MKNVSTHDNISATEKEEGIEKPSYFAVIPAEVRYCKELEPAAKLLYGEITCLASRDSFCWASNEFFANLYDVDVRTVTRWIQSLQMLGFIKCEILKQGFKTVRRIHLCHFFKIFQRQENNDRIDPDENGFSRQDKNGAHSNTSIANNTRTATAKEEELEQHNIQHQTILSDVPAVVFFDPKNSYEKTAKESMRAAIYPCLDQIQIDSNEKAWITSHYPEDTVKNAIEWATHAQTKISTTVVQALKWACAKRPQVPKTQEDIVSSNKQLADMIEKQ